MDADIERWVLALFKTYNESPVVVVGYISPNVILYSCRWRRMNTLAKFDTQSRSLMTARNPYTHIFGGFK
jgi:hypothetical protein